MGAHFLHKKNPKFHLNSSIEKLQILRKNKNRRTSSKPEKKIQMWFEYLKKEKSSQKLRVLRRYYHKKYIIKEENIPDTYFEYLKNLAKKRGMGDVIITPQIRAEHTEIIIGDQISSLNRWIDFFISSESEKYPLWLKYWAFHGMLNLADFNKKTYSFNSRSKNQVKPFPDLNPRAIEYVLDAIFENVTKRPFSKIYDDEFLEILDGANFGKLYALALKYEIEEQKLYRHVIDGEWVKYSQFSNPIIMSQSLHGYITNLCIAELTTSKHQLDQGDFYIYYTNDSQGKPKIPRVVIKTVRREGTIRVTEIAGMEENQKVDKDILESGIIALKLQNLGSEAVKYYKRIYDMETLTKIYEKQKRKEELTRDELIFLYEFNYKIDGFGYKKDPRLYEIVSYRNLKEDLAFLLGIAEEDLESLWKDDKIPTNIDPMMIFLQRFLWE